VIYWHVFKKEVGRVKKNKLDLSGVVTSDSPLLWITFPGLKFSLITKKSHNETKNMLSQCVSFWNRDIVFR
jgi:hypothetical protein